MISGGFPIPTPKRSPAAAMADLAGSDARRKSAALPADLETRIAAFERAAPPGDFDTASWFWMILLGVEIPLLLLAAGWYA